MILIIVLFTISMPLVVEVYGGYLSVALIMLLGIPHGAIDHILFKHIKKDYSKGWLYRFFAQYFLLMGLLSLTWWTLPSLALIVFLAVSAYHFGQSQWHSLQANTILKRSLYCSWGAFVLAAPLLWNYTETAPIIEKLIGIEIIVELGYQLFIPVLFLVLIILQTLVLFFRRKISRQKLLEEWAILLLLTGLFYYTPLLVGFAVYFVFWHSIDSIEDQIIRLRAIHSEYTIKTHLKQVIPFTLMAFGSIGLSSWLLPAGLMTSAWISQLFILISIVTLPHSLLMDSFLEAGVDGELKTEREQNQYKNQNHHVIDIDHLKRFRATVLSEKLKLPHKNT